MLFLLLVGGLTLRLRLVCLCVLCVPCVHHLYHISCMCMYLHVDIS